MTIDEILRSLNDNEHLGCSQWQYFEYGRQFYCGSRIISAEAAEVAALLYANPRPDPEPQDQQ